jgi:prophage regulatory protein
MKNKRKIEKLRSIFPKPIKLSSNAVGWFEHELVHWLELKAEQRFTC